MSTTTSHLGVLPLPLARGGLGVGTLTDHGVLVGSGTDPVTALAVGTNGQVILGSTGADPAFGTLTSSNSSITFTPGAGSLGLAVTQATTTQLGGAETATDAEAIAKASASVVVTPSNLAALGSSDTFAGLVELATDAETRTGTDTSRATTPANVAALKAYTDLRFNQSPILQSSATTGAAPSGATGAVNLMQFQSGEIMEQFILGAGQTIIAPRMSSTGLLTSLDLTNAEGVEYNFGAALSNSKHAYTIGTSAAFFIELQVAAADVGGLDPFMVGFRKSAANDATLSNYTDFVSIGAHATTAADVIVLQTQLNGGGVVITNTTDAWTDGQTKTFRVNVSGAGVVTYLINGIAPTTTAAFTFDNGDVVVPFIRHLFGATTPAAINWIQLKIGLQ